ncbi:metal ABC transporter substrate-binding protein [Butyrivibrio proteoclasticus]|uniref:metal ABC transporter substrate-binding protein n=1 Tax=Butyrivibrio proteoclasticus TaxID=43305 RepID=UPI0004795D48|nr:metal ABC transporter substrate-binding protein [Butyrivibrio proteoclasticus]
MKKFVSTMLATALFVLSLTGCAGAAAGDSSASAAQSDAVAQNGSDSQTDAAVLGATANQDQHKLSIVTTIFPEYDWVMNVLGGKAGDAEVTMLLDNGVDLHSYQPTTEDILKISTCDIFIYVGGESDEWVEDALLEATNKDMIVIDLLDELGDSIKEEEVVEGMQGEEEEDEEAGGEEEEVEYDEHVWLSLKNAQVLVSSIDKALEQVDPDNADTYKANAESYNAQLSDLDKKYQDAVSQAANKTVLFGDRFPFRYLVDDYGLSYYAAFVGCSAETEASFETITFLSSKVNELGLSAILTIEGPNKKIAETIRDNTDTKDQQILTMDSMQATTSQDVASGASYYSIMESNLAVLEQALN